MSKATTAVVSLLILASAGVLPVSLQAHVAAHFSGALSPLGSELASPGGVAVDGSGNVYIADGGGPQASCSSKRFRRWAMGMVLLRILSFSKSLFESRSRYEAGAHNYVQS